MQPNQQVINDTQGAAIVFDHVHKHFGAFTALSEFCEVVQKGEVIVLCGPSGSGKSTLVRTVNGLERIQSGRVIVDGRDVTDPTLDLDKLRQGIGFVFQQYNLFPHLNAIDNVALGLRRLLGQPKEEAYANALVLLERVGLKDKATRRPSGLSGGEQQRVAIARSLAMRPPVILFDEPTSALDPQMAGEVKSLIASLVDDNMTIMCVTHDLGFAQAIADRIWFLEGGVLIQSAAPDAFIGSDNPRVRSFLSKILTSHG
ncbi:polar amino acid transport system ATP-binding protein [Aminobacter lissarensis]|uniref:Polar amino acid transport system ATP-binding protein n=1 Tax=Aminobacter carboxidus TaxID=376165 RepID=A0A8E1WII1_9HYPH|nr:amino acid ABC transporter ATP-binding protein [Aminobacter lissarensis]MBB6469112.1 polar amino acid transport system ATP-binding protein [Aminobacter lissarensis]